VIGGGTTFSPRVEDKVSVKTAQPFFNESPRSLLGWLLRQGEWKAI
jgi:hypothetical protein